MKILIVGCGGIGGYFGGRLIEAGVDVTFLARPNRARQLQQGLNILSCRGNVSLPVKTITKQDLQTDPQQQKQYDLIILTCKAYDLDSCLDDIENLVTDKTAILPLLNGLSHYQKLQQRFGIEKTLYGYCNISAGIIGDGDISHFNAIHELTVGKEHPVNFDYDKLINTLKLANFNTRDSSCILQELWEKFVFINALAGFTTLLRADVGTIVETTGGTKVITSMLEECQNIANAAGYPIRRRADKIARDAMLKPKSTFSASMLKDMLANKSVESEALIGDLVRYAYQHQVKAPLLEAAYCQLQTYQLNQPSQVDLSSQANQTGQTENQGVYYV